MKARELIGSNGFVEGYGNIVDMNIVIESESTDTEVIE